ncbi:MAG TPA: phage tail assembly protein [Chloroflexota bacterium]|nr:phage tail assembly protein [Chloroflexota bacterium]
MSPRSESLQTEFEFALPKGYVDKDGNLHKKGTMRLATAADEIEPLRDPRVRQNQAYMTVILLARVITKLGSLSDSAINPSVIEGIFSADLAYLQALYRRINENASTDLAATCPECGHKFEVDMVAGMGES